MSIFKKLLAALIISTFLAAVPLQAESIDVKYDKRYVEMCERIGGRYHVSPEILEAIIEHESGGDPDAGLDSTKCYGLMGVSAYWNRDRMKRLGVTDLHDPEGNILVAADLLLELFEEMEDPYEVLRFYGGYPEGDYRFSEQILQRAWELEVLHGKQDYLVKG